LPDTCFSFKKWQIEIKKIAAVANAALIGYHLCKSELLIPTNAYAGLKETHAPSIAMPSSSCFLARSNLFSDWQ
jgi:hypothetical protein